MSYSSHSPSGGCRCQPLPPRKVDRCSSHYWLATTQLHISLTPPSLLFHTRIDAWPQQWDNTRAMTAWRGVSTPMQSAHCAMSYVVCIGLERTRWISNGYGYPSDLDMVTLFRPWNFHGWAGTAFRDMNMDLVLFNPIQTRPIAILKQDWLKVQWKKRCSIVSSMC